MTRTDEAAILDLDEHPLRPLSAVRRETPRTRTIVVRQQAGWQAWGLLAVCVLLIAVVLLAQWTLRSLDARHQDQQAALARMEGKLQRLESGIGFDSHRRQMLVGMRDHIMKVNPHVSLGDAYHYAELALNASEKYPSVDPLLLLAIGTVESRFETNATSSADARGLYQIWPSTGRLLLRSLGWQYDDAALFDPQKNTEAAALYLDILFSTYSDPALVLAEYNGGPLNAGYFRARVGQLAAETRNYVPQVLALQERLTRDFAQQGPAQLQLMHMDAHRQGKTLAGPVPSGIAAVQPAQPPTPARR
ncbi:MAG TPA: transglycosylase SLT domain-containing protein [Vicinamibacteria bacterium]|nr:transglycosylase SLT domain-containing protein [Vicinamibacteria bacterium]